MGVIIWGLVIVTRCGHSGITNSMRHVQALAGVGAVDACIL
jgi:metal-dependent hydrolase (beta-lactamase superfamily II)